ncbi:hypothetical protein D3C72_2524430 [compost metagenome]
MQGDADDAVGDGRARTGVGVRMLGRQQTAERGVRALIRRHQEPGEHRIGAGGLDEGEHDGVLVAR